MMTQLKILELAQSKAIQNWGEAQDRLEAYPDDKTARENEKIAYKEVVELYKRISLEYELNGNGNPSGAAASPTERN